MKSIVVYFSRADENYFNGTIQNLSVGNTEIIAHMISKELDCDDFKMIPIQPYSKSYNECISQAQEDLKRDARPELKVYPESLDEYDSIYLGYPNYWGTMPMCVCTFLEHFDLKNKRIYPFCTHEGSGFGQSLNDLKKICPESEIMNGLSIHGADAKKSESKVIDWLRGGN